MLPSPLRLISSVDRTDSTWEVDCTTLARRPTTTISSTPGMETSGCSSLAARGAAGAAGGAAEGASVEEGWSAARASVGAASALDSSNRGMSRRFVMFQSPWGRRPRKKGGRHLRPPPFRLSPALDQLVGSEVQEPELPEPKFAAAPLPVEPAY